ncbi:hypothetical protein TRICI_006701 [Trichomonascus ciferrii]|uniref:Uncharacterized protein n=1 Tax=Trichomonascus ciferrii TaxID=44093 RepID=A0A642UEL2_9ASCO|nr:hypothetical protein TRICI_006701 [Trichomonascus ciferrii]
MVRIQTWGKTIINSYNKKPEYPGALDLADMGHAPALERKFNMWCLPWAPIQLLTSHLLQGTLWTKLTLFRCGKSKKNCSLVASCKGGISASQFVRPKTKEISRYKYKEADWEQFCWQLGSGPIHRPCMALTTENLAEKLAGDLNGDLQLTLEATVPKLGLWLCRYSGRWWNEELRGLLQKTKMARIHRRQAEYKC